MDRGAWQATVHGVTRVGYDLVTQQQQQHMCVCVYVYTHYFSTCHWFGRLYFHTNLLKIQALAWLHPVNSTSKYITYST